MKTVSLISFIFLFQFSFSQSLPLRGLGDKVESLENTSFVNTTTILQNGSNTLSIGYKTSRTTNYQVSRVGETGYRITVLPVKIIDTISAFGKEAVYNSCTKPESASLFGTQIMNLVKHPVKISVEQNGLIKEVDSLNPILNKDVLVTLVGLEPEAFEIGTPIEWIPDFPFDTSFSVGKEWSTSVKIGEKLIETRFILHEKTEGKSIVLYNRSISEPKLNTAINGALVIDNYTKAIIERSFKSIAAGYVQVNGVWCEMDSRRAGTKLYLPKMLKVAYHTHKSKSGDSLIFRMLSFFRMTST